MKTVMKTVVMNMAGKPLVANSCFFQFLKSSVDFC